MDQTAFLKHPNFFSRAICSWIGLVLVFCFSSQLFASCGHPIGLSATGNSSPVAVKVSYARGMFVLQHASPLKPCDGLNCRASEMKPPGASITSFPAGVVLAVDSSQPIPIFETPKNQPIPIPRNGCLLSGYLDNDAPPPRI
jgi:hypothetical protein